MIVVRLAGGLGNQMFQYAHGRALSVAANRRLGLDLSFFAACSERRYELGAFRIQARPLGTMAQMLVSRFSAPRYERWRRFFPLVELSDVDARLPLPRRPLYLRGYWQHERFFAPVALQLRREFGLRRPLSGGAQRVAAMMGDDTTISLHVRRGDLVSNPYYRQLHGLLGADYYETAARALADRTGAAVFFVFSDDMGWARGLRLPRRAVYVDAECSAAEALWLMSRCSHHVIANSTFSWWAAWLNASATKLVVAPRVWILNGEATSDPVPSTWIRV